MPIYEYRCSKGHTFEEVRSMRDKYNSSWLQCHCGNCAIEAVVISETKTKYGAPPRKATRKFGEQKRTPHPLAKWI